MNAKLTKILLYLPTTALGLWCMHLQNQILSQGYDERGLLDIQNPRLWLMWAITGVFLVTVLLLLPRLGGQGTYKKNFPRCALSGSVMIAAGVLMAFCGLDEMVPGQGLLPVITMAAGVMMGVCGVYRLRGRRPPCWFDLAVCLFYCTHLMLRYRSWNADPQLQMYAYPLLAGVAAMLFSLHRARCAGGMMDRRRLVFTGFAGIFLCFAAMSGAEHPLFYCATGLWCAGGMCELRRFRRRPAKPAPAVEQPDPVAEEPLPEQET